MRLFIAALTLSAGLLAGEDMTIPFEGGKILIENANFLRSQYGSVIPELSFTLRNGTTSAWPTLKLRFDIQGACNGEPRQWSDTVVAALLRFDDEALNASYKRDYKDLVIPLVGEVEGCRTDKIKASVLLAENTKFRIDFVTGVRTDLEAERQAQLEISNEKLAKEFAAREEERKKQSAEAAKLRTACAGIYGATANKKVGDLTVKEAQQVKACQDLGLYRP